MTTLADVISASSPPESWDGVRVRRLAVSPTVGTSRRAFLRAVVGVVTLVGLNVAGLLPPLRRAMAHCGHGNCKNYLETTLNPSLCPGNTDGFGCNPACGPSTVYSTACSGGWHRYDNVTWLTRPNECTVSPYDGWYWDRGGCGCATGYVTRFRCHDGCKNVGGSWCHSICRFIVLCYS